MLLDTRRPPVAPRLPVRLPRLQTATPQSIVSKSYGFGAAVRLATELAEEGNFIDANRVALDFRRYRPNQSSLITSLAEKLISRDISITSVSKGDTILSTHRQNGQKSPAIVTRNTVGKIKVNATEIKPSGIDLFSIAPNGKTHAYTIGKQLLIDKLSGQGVIRTDGHDAKIRLIAMSDDGSIIATYGDDAFVRIWDSENGTPITSIPLRDIGHPYLSISPSGDLICIAVSNGPARYLNLKGEGVAHILRPRGTHATAICPLPDGRAFVVGCLDGTARIMEMKMGRESAVIEGDGSPVVHVNASSDGRRILIQTRSGRISVYATANAERTHIWQLLPDARFHHASFTSNDSISFARGQATIATVSLTETGIWETVEIPKAELTDAHLIQRDQFLLCGDTSGRLVKVDTKTGLAGSPIQCHRRRIHNIRSHPTSARFVTMASWDKTASIVDVTSLEPVMMFTGHADRVRDAMLSPDGKIMVTVSDDRTCRFWDASNGKALHVSTLPEHPLGIEACTTSSATIIDVNGSIITIKRGQIKPIAIRVQRFDSPVTNVVTNGTHAAYLAGSTLRTTDTRTRTDRSTTSSDRITACYLPPSQPFVAVGTNTGHIQLWDSDGMSQLIDIQGTNCQIATLGYNKAGDFLYVIGVDGHLKCLRLEGANK